MPTLEEKKELILGAERQLAGWVAGDVVDKPQLGMWMILIPIFFVFYYFQYKRYKNGLKDFSRNFLLTRQRTLDAVYDGINENRTPDLESLLNASDMVAETKTEYLDWVSALADFYEVLMRADGRDYNSLVRAAYKNRSSYLVTLNKLSSVEQLFNEALAPHLGDDETVGSVITAMQKSVRKNRKDMVALIFA